MKLICRSFLLLLLVVGVASCDDEPVGDSYGSNTDPNAQFRVDIDGETFYGELNGMLTEDGQTQIVGRRSDGAKVEMKVEGAGEGTYALSGSEAGSAFYYDGVSSEPYDMTEVDTVGVLTITHYDAVNGLASGTFSFHAYREPAEEPDDPEEPGDGEDDGGSEETGKYVTHADGDEDGGDDEGGSEDDGDNGDEDGDTNQEETPGLLDFTNGTFTNIPLNVIGDNPDEPTPPEDGQSAFHVELNGELYETEDINANYTLSEGLLIETQRDTSQFDLTLFNPQVGSVALNGTDGKIVYTPNTAEETTYQADEGTIQITDVDMDALVITGTFTGTLTDVDDPESTIEMTNGVFEDIHFTSEISDADYIKAKIGEENFNTIDISTAEGDEEGLIEVKGIQDNGNTLSFLLPSSVNTGTYQISTTAAYSAKYFNAENDDEYGTVLNSGSIKVTGRTGTQITGTFTFSVRNTAGEVIQVTGGEFNVDIAL